MQYMERVLSHELMDDADVPNHDLSASLAYIRGINRRLGGVTALVGHLKRWSSGWKQSERITLLDIATGSADLPVEARKWALSAGFDLQVTGVDVHEKTLDFARKHVQQASEQDARVGEGIELFQADAKQLMERFDAQRFDYVHAGMFLHHLPEIEVLTVLRIMERLAARGIIWNDLVRSRVAHAAIRVLTIGQPEIVRHDARVSVEAGFTKREVLEYARRLDLDWCRYSWSFFTQRFTLAGVKP